MPTWTKEVVDLSVAGTSLTIDNIKIDGNTIGHTGDTDLLTLTAGTLTVAGALITSSTMSIGGDATINGNMVVEGTITLDNGELISNAGDGTISMTTDTLAVTSSSTNVSVTLKPNLNASTNIVFFERPVGGVASWSIGNHGPSDVFMIDTHATVGSDTKFSITQDGDVTIAGDATITGDLVVSGNNITFGNGEIINNSLDGSFQVYGLGGTDAKFVLVGSSNQDVYYTIRDLGQDRWNFGYDDSENKFVIEGGTSGLGTSGQDFVFDDYGNFTLRGDLTVTGNDIKGSGGTAITMDGSNNVTIAGDLAVTGGDITSSSGAISFGNENLSTTGDLTVGGYIDVDGIAYLDVCNIDGAVQLDATFTVGVNDTGYDVKFFGASSGSYMEWDESEDKLRLEDAGTDTSSNPEIEFYRNSSSPANGDDLGKISFYGNTEADGGSTDTKTQYASIYAEVGEHTTGAEEGTIKFDVMSDVTDGSPSLFQAMMLVGSTDDASGAPKANLWINNGEIHLVSTDSDPNARPYLYIWNNEASPANEDPLGTIVWQSNDSAGNRDSYGKISCQATDITHGQQQGQMRLNVMVNDGGGSGGTDSHTLIGLKLQGQDDSTIDVDIAKGATSKTEIEGYFACNSATAIAAPTYTATTQTARNADTATADAAIQDVLQTLIADLIATGILQSS